MSSKNRKMQRKLKREDNKKKMISELRMASLGFIGNRFVQTTCEPIKIPEGIISELHRPVIQFGKTEAFTEVIKALGCDREISYDDMIKMNNKTYEDSLTTFRESVAKLESIIEFPKVME